MAQTQIERRHDIDWLRVFATYLVVVFHVIMVFNPAPFYHIRNDEVSTVAMIAAGFIGLWHMPLFFLLAGWSVFASLQTRGTRAFLWERLFKLWIPLLAACVLLMPTIKYLELRSGFDANYTGLYVAAELQSSFKEIIPSGLPVAVPFTESFWQFLPTFFTRLDRFTWAHMWFVVYLLTFTLLYLPVFRWCARHANRPIQIRSWWIYAPILPLALVQIFLRPHWPGLQNLYDDWANFAYYSIYVLSGFCLACFPATERVIRTEWKRALSIGILTTLFLLLAVLGLVRQPALILAGSAVAGWCFVLALLGAANKFLRRESPALRYLVESAFPVYILHQSAVVLVGYAVIQLPAGMLVKFFLLLPAAMLATVATYHFVVRPFAATRFLFGMRRLPASARWAPSYGTALLLGATVCLAAATAARAASSPVGVWYAEGGAARVEIRECADGLCGKIVWLRSPFDENGCELLDSRNPDPSLRHRSVIGLDILAGLEPSNGDTAHWEDGTIYDPVSGNTYRATLRLVETDRIHVRGYVGIPLLGRTTTWIRVGAEERLCREGP